MGPGQKASGSGLVYSLMPFPFLPSFTPNAGDVMNTDFFSPAKIIIIVVIVAGYLIFFRKKRRM